MKEGKLGMQKEKMRAKSNKRNVKNASELITLSFKPSCHWF
jgi:hypothetical protein